jgi:hypothetical protein
MPAVSQAPAVIPIPELSEREKQDRTQDIDAVTKKYAAIRGKISKLFPALDEIISDYIQLQRDCDKSPPIRAVHLSRRIGLVDSLKGAAGAKFLLMQLIKTSDRSIRHVEAAQTEVLAPDLPGVERDVSEVREMLRKMAKENKKR